MLPCCATTSTSLSAVPLPNRCAIVFDLDDTLYPERDFVVSGFRAISAIVEREIGESVFERLIELFDAGHCDPIGEVSRKFCPISPWQALLDTHRYHFPGITLAPSVARLLTELKSHGHMLGLLTDGRSITQRNKIRALGLEAWLDEIVISEEFGSDKPAARNYRHFEMRFDRKNFVYVGDNPAKDFHTPNRRGWLTVGVRDHGDHIHSQAANYQADELPQRWIDSLA